MPPLAFVVAGAAWQVAPLMILVCCSLTMQRLLQAGWTPELAKRKEGGEPRT